MSLDIPSGVNGDSGRIMGDQAVRDAFFRSFVARDSGGYKIGLSVGACNCDSYFWVGEDW